MLMSGESQIPICPTCSEGITNDLTLCPSCSTPYHFNCASSSGGCIIPNCAANLSASDPSENADSLTRGDIRQKVLIGVIGVVLLILGITIGALGAKANLLEFATGRLSTASAVEEAQERVRTTAYGEGKTAGYDEGFATGRTTGYDNGLNDGKSNGYTDGYSSGVASGYQSGLTEGRRAGCQQVFNALDTTQVFPYFTGNRYLSSLPSYQLSRC